MHKDIKKRKIDLEVINDDFFPYKDKPNAYWTGYFETN